MMNNPYKMATPVPYGYPYPNFPATGANVPMVPNGSTILPNGTTVTPTLTSSGVNVPGLLPAEESFIENILRLNLGKIATLYMTYENNSEWNAKIFKGRLEAAGRDHIIISDPATGMRYLLLMVNLDYITFDEELNYSYPFANTGGSMTAPRR
ncbi:spore coat protein GerQ [Paenibacillus athensensis]|uniref:Spore coat protein GerQ n=1 Tax=Paenibacillus athensensis TaxID=1967502 RepID=A0A4Y8Q6J0_9BACL|nr:spore coat protein GerQ [Paenibacillus athensensis]MCD1259839.1 spore coat protein GerQ [Paenibacillus athensensis]